MPSFLKIPKVQLTLALFLISLTAIVKNFSLTSLSVILMALALSISFDLIFLYLRKIDLFVPYAAIVSGFIIGLIIDPQSSWYQIALTAFFAMGFKNFLRLQQKHIFNPAGIGLVVLGLFAQSISWWGVSFQTILVNLNFQNILFFLILLLPLLI